MYGRIRLDGNADSQDRTNHMNQDNRFHFKSKPPEPKPNPTHICPGSNLHRTHREFQGVGETFLNCAVCRARGRSRETIGLRAHDHGEKG